MMALEGNQESGHEGLCNLIWSFCTLGKGQEREIEGFQQDSDMFRFKFYSGRWDFDVHNEMEMNKAGGRGMSVLSKCSMHLTHLEIFSKFKS